MVSDVICGRTEATVSESGKMAKECRGAIDISKPKKPSIS